MKKHISVELNNGAKLYYLKNTYSKITMTNIVFNCGSRYDTIPGLAHFTEHLFLSGTKKYSKTEMSRRYFEFINANMATNISKIYFMGNVFTKEFKDYLAIVSEAVTETTFSPKALKDEAKVIKQEIAAYKDNFQLNAFYFNDYNITKEDVYINSELGSEESLDTIKSKDVKNFVKKYFVQQNMEVYVSSPLSVKEVKKLVEKTLLEKIPTNNKFEKLPLYQFKVKDDSFYEIKTTPIGKSYVFVNFVVPCDPKDFKRIKKLELLLKLMNNHTEGIMNDLRWGGDKNLTYGAWFHASQGETERVISFYTECSKENINPILETLSNYLNRISKEGFTQKILDFEKRSYKYADDAKEPNLRMEFYKLYDFRIYGKVRDEKLMRKYISETTLEDCHILFHEIFDNPRISVSVYGDASKKDVLSKSQFIKLFK